MRLDAEYERKSVSFWSEAIRYLATCCHSRVILFGEIESMLLRVILSPFDKLRVNSVEESLNTSLHSAPASLRA